MPRWQRGYLNALRGVQKQRKGIINTQGKLSNKASVPQNSIKGNLISAGTNILEKHEFMKDWVNKLKERKKLNNNNQRKKNVNPKIIPRNHIVERILDEAIKGDYKNLYKLLNHLINPYKNNIDSELNRIPTEEEKIHETFCGT